MIENIIDGSYGIASIAIDSLNSICSELKEGMPRFFYHYTRLILLINENPKNVNFIIEIFQGQKDSSSAREVIEFMIDNGRSFEDDERRKWVEANRRLNKVGD